MVDDGNNFIPVATDISTSTHDCSRSGQPMFTVTIIYECTAGATIWALYKHWSWCGNGIEYWDPFWRGERRLKWIGPRNRHVGDRDEDEPDIDPSHTELIRLEPGETLQKSYTFDVSDASDRLYRNDIRYLLVGNQYQLGMRHQKWWWMYEAEMPPNLSVEEKRLFLYDRRPTEWKPQEMLTFKVVE